MLGRDRVVRAERLRDVLVEVGREGQRRVQVKHQTPVRRRVVHVEHVVVPYHELFVAAAGLLPPQGHRPPLVRHEHGVASGQFRRMCSLHLLAQLPHVLFTKNGEKKDKKC